MDDYLVETHTPGEARTLHAHPDVTGLYYWPDAVSAEMAAEVEEYLSSDEPEWKVVGRGQKSRRASHTGYDYDYKSRKVTSTDPIPEVLQQLATRARELCTALQLNVYEEHIPEIPVFNQCLVNEYLSKHSHGINYHVDLDTFGPFIACYTFGSGTEMVFRMPGSDDDPIGVRVEPRSLYIMSSHARWTWQHSMPSRKSDPNPTPEDGRGKRIARGDRTSVTFRHVGE
jgi:alkylated DNA repair protein alkB family protein 8